MSVESEILRIQRNIADTYAVVAAKGGTVPLHPTSANLAAAVASIPDASIPTGGIIIWSGAADAIPDGWALCNGENGTPDLRGRFVLGSSDSRAIGSVGGSEEVTLTEAQIPKHRHFEYLQSPGTSVTYYYRFNNSSGSSIGVTINNDAIERKDTFSSAAAVTSYVGSSKPHSNMPPYYTLAYIMKL